ncbi:MAG: penicillin-binding protein 2 [bacterium]
MRNYQHSDIQRDRTPIVIILFVILTAVIAARLFYLQVIEHKTYVALASSQHSLKDTIYAKRGQIFVDDSISDTSYVVASNQSLDLVYINPHEIENKKDTIAKLSSIISVSLADIEAKYDEKLMYIRIKHRLTPAESKAIESAEMKGVGLQNENWRYYPENSLASSVLGFVNDESVGTYGIEQHYNDSLEGVNGYLNEEVDPYGNKIAFGKDISKPAVNGSDIYLTIDRYIQQKAETFLADAIKKYSAKSGSVIVMDKTTGKITALANFPTFDPNKFTEVKDNAAFRNKAISDVYEPGSVFKAVTMAAGIDSGKITPDSTFTDTGSIVLNDNSIKNSDLKAHGVCTMTTVLSKSLNTGTTYVEQLMGKNVFYDYIKKFGFGTQTGIELGDEEVGFFNKPENFNDHGYATMSFGQSISTTPIQMVQSFATLANNGVMMKPYIIDKVVQPDGKETVTKPKEVRRVVSEKTALQLQTMLVDVVVNGHGFQAKIKGYKIAGKTGTAQVIDPNGGYLDGKNIGTFIGFPVAENANFVVLAKIDEPTGVPWAEESAAPLVAQMLDFLLKYYQIPPTE